MRGFACKVDTFIIKYKQNKATTRHIRGSFVNHSSHHLLWNMINFDPPCVQDNPPPHGWTGLYLSVESHTRWWTRWYCCCTGHISSGSGGDQTHRSELQRAHVYRCISHTLKGLQKWRASSALQGILPHCLRCVAHSHKFINYIWMVEDMLLK